MVAVWEYDWALNTAAEMVALMVVLTVDMMDVRMVSILVVLMVLDKVVCLGKLPVAESGNSKDIQLVAVKVMTSAELLGHEKVAQRAVAMENDAAGKWASMKEI